MKRKRIILILIFSTFFIVGLLTFWGIKSTNVKHVKIGVIDTNLSENYKQEYNVNFFIQDTNNSTTTSTHADMVVDTIKSRDAYCEIYLANVLNGKNTSDIDDVIKALEWLKQQEVDIICMSFTAFEDNEGLRRIINELTKSGILIVTSCLNYSNIITYPACYDGVISVANCNYELASISVTSRKIKDELKATKWQECSTSILTAYIVGELSRDMSNGKLYLDKFVSKYNM